jgi:hypothetical protein
MQGAPFAGLRLNKIAAGGQYQRTVERLGEKGSPANGGRFSECRTEGDCVLQGRDFEGIPVIHSVCGVEPPVERMESDFVKRCTHAGQCAL